MAFVTTISPWITYRLATRELLYDIWLFVFPVPPVEHVSLPVGRHCRISRVYGSLSRRNAMDSIGDSSVQHHRAPLRAHCSATDSERRKF